MAAWPKHRIPVARTHAPVAQSPVPTPQPSMREGKRFFTLCLALGLLADRLSAEYTWQLLIHT